MNFGFIKSNQIKYFANNFCNGIISKAGLSVGKYSSVFTGVGKYSSESW